MTTDRYSEAQLMPTISQFIFPSKLFIFLTVFFFKMRFYFILKNGLKNAPKKVSFQNKTGSKKSWFVECVNRLHINLIICRYITYDCKMQIKLLPTQ